MTLPSSGAISLNQVNTELGRGGTASLGMNDSGVRGLTGQSGGAVDMNSLHGKSYAITYNVAPGSYTVDKDGTYGITASRSVTWTVSATGSIGTYTPASGAASTTWNYVSRSAATGGAGNITLTNSDGKTWTLAVSNSAQGGGACVSIDSYLPNGKQAVNAAVNDDMILLNREDDDGWHTEPIRAVSFATRPCLRLVTKSGISLVASIETPITTKLGVVVPIAESLGVEVPVLDRGVFRWEPIVLLEDAGEHIVAKINVNDGTYAASETNDDRYVLTHNIKN